jgi:hypothetical protein
VITISKPVTRRTRGAYAVLYHQPRAIVVTLAAGDLLEFREAGRRSKWTLPIDAGFRYAVRTKALAESAERRAHRKGRGL